MADRIIPNCTGRQYPAGCRCATCRTTHRECQRRYSRTAKGLEAKRRRHRAWRTANAEKVRANKARYRRTHREAIRAYAAKWREANRRTAAPLTTTWPFTRDAEHLDPFTLAINAAIPRSLPPDIREEVAQDIAVDLLTNSGTITPEAVAAAVRQYWKRYPVMAGHEISLDAPAYTNDGNSRERRIDLIADPASLATLDEERAARYGAAA